MNNLDLDVLLKILKYLNKKKISIKQNPKKKKAVQNHYMVKNLNVLLILFLKKKNVKHLTLIKNA